jgi:hypothetical protein
MAKKRRTNSLKKIEQGLEVLYNGTSRLIESPPPNLTGMSNRIFLASDKVLDGLWAKGIDCKCGGKRTGRRSWKYSCDCRPRQKGKRRR